MKRIFLVVGILSLMIGLNACKGKQEKQNVPDEAIDAAHNSRNSLDWNGVYTGVIPCADCPGIRTKVVLNTDNTYTISREYVDRKDGLYNYSGSFVWDEDGGVISVKEDDREPATRFKVGENILIQLDMEGNVITGDLADNYVLVKANPDLLEKHWKLVELSGNPVNFDNSKEAFIVFKLEDNQITGNAGCNNIRGTYWLGENNRLLFSQMVATMMMCLNMDIEKQLLKALEATNRYSLEGDTGNALVLEKDTVALARFVPITE
jgi:heat shock protein HslJ